ncbi:zinc finger BED domain-containing protein RICESLEEPER 2-like [Olea europaea var. sylvestris]|uniref:zinc finger BED domain-containing protein RICESLEEPER 2-like n=1 Tax=Olea europaea var. sylvestris TaxID=158386 RepID=UPI000C1D3DE5|nr:zinc finger BED domain-containing protein RICESLEEPER 2-like [Olea europaea var. sylvestris]
MGFDFQLVSYMDPILKEADDAIPLEDDPEDMKLEGKCKKGNKRSEKYPYRVQDKKQKKMTGYNMFKTEELSKGIDSQEELAKFAKKEDEGFQGYTRYFFPRFVFPSRMANVSYLCLTAHWIGNDWKLQKRIISFIQVPSHKGDTVGKELIFCLKDKGINKIFCVTVDNASSNDVALLRLKSYFEEKKDGLVPGGEMLHMRCCDHILNLIRFVRSSPKRLKRFKESCKEANIESQALLCLDVTTRWNSTYLMLQAATKFKKTFVGLESDGNYTNYFNDERSDGRNINGPPTHVEWDQVEVFVRFLKTFYKMTLKSSGSKYVTSNSFFQEIFEIHVELNELAKEPNTLMGSMAISMRKKYDKYWGHVEKFNQLLFIAIVLDPRCKLELLKVGFELIYDVEIAKILLKRFEETLHRLYACYEEMSTPITPPSASSKEATKNSSSSPSQPAFGLSKQIPSIFKAKLMQNTQSEKNDLVDYLSDRCEDLIDPKFDVLVRWKLNAHKYKILSKIAKDVLAIQISTVALESTFSTSGRILDSFRSSLNAKMVETLICTKNWLHSSNEPIVLRRDLDEAESLNDSEKARPNHVLQQGAVIQFLSNERKPHHNHKQPCGESLLKKNIWASPLKNDLFLKKNKRKPHELAKN